MTCQTIAKVLQRSIGHDAPPITTFQLRYPRIIHAELMTHRVFSRNARSSRAVPVPRLIEEVRNEPFVPRYWGANQKGMQASADCNELVMLPVPVISHPFDGTKVVTCDRPFTNIDAWLWARDRAVEAATAFHNAGYHKQVVNRLLEPFMHIDVVVTGTKWSNFFALRDHEMAEPHIRDLARAMKEAVAAYGEPQQLGSTNWHLPYVGVADYEAVDELPYREAQQTLRALSVTRCAQVSYTPFHEAKLTIAEEVARHDQLISAQPMHASPAEHQATPDRLKSDGTWENPHLHGNLRGWIQYRKTLQGETA